MPEISEEELKALKDAQEKAKVLESTNERLLEESKKNKQKADENADRLSKIEEEKLKSEGKTQELLDKEKLRAAELEEKLKNKTKSALKQKLRNEVSKAAKDALDVDMVLRVTEHKSLLKIDEESESITGIEDYVSKVRETHSFLFGKRRMPEGEEGGKPKPGEQDDDSNQSDEEKFRAELANVNSRKEQVEVYKKYGKPLDSFMMQR